jgi:hypothetical protein
MGFICQSGELLGWHVCKMWEHGWCLEGVQQDNIMWCGHLECHVIKTCDMWGRAEGARIVLTNATWRCEARVFYFCGGVECMC